MGTMNMDLIESTTKMFGKGGGGVIISLTCIPVTVKADK